MITKPRWQLWCPQLCDACAVRVVTTAPRSPAAGHDTSQCMECCPDMWRRYSPHCTGPVSAQEMFPVSWLHCLNETCLITLDLMFLTLTLLSWREVASEKKTKQVPTIKKKQQFFSVSHSYVFMFTSTLHPVLHFTIIQCMEINLTVTPAAKQVTVKSCCRYVICRVSHFVLVVFLASRARTNEYFTIFQQPRRREFQNSPYFPPYVTEKNMRQTGF